MSDEIEKLREELAEANARRADMRTALEWACEERDRLQRERDEAREELDRYKGEHQYSVGLSMALEQRDEARAELHASNEQMNFIAKALQLEHDDDIEDAVTDMVAEMEHARDRIEELRAEVERLRGEYQYSVGLSMALEQRDEARAEAKKLGDALTQETRLSIAMATQRDEACAKAETYERDWYAAKSDFGTAMEKMREALRAAEKRELEALAGLDEASAEVATAAKYCDELAETIRMHVAREIELESEVAELRADYDRVVTDLRRCASEPYEHAPERAAAYRRGAEAMRKQVMNWLVRAQAEATVIVVDTAIRGVHKLPIPGER